MVGCHNPTLFSLNVDNAWTCVCAFWGTSPHLGAWIRLKTSSNGLWWHHSFSVERNKCFCKLPPIKMGLSHVMQNNGAAFRKNKDINDFVGKNKMSFVL